MAVSMVDMRVVPSVEMMADLKVDSMVDETVVTMADLMVD